MRLVSLLGGLLLLTAPASAAPPAATLGLPIACAMGEDCFVQQWPDMDPGAAAEDPFCGPATYDGHDGTDIRVRSMLDVERGVPVLAAADGVVTGLRDGVPDHLVQSDADAAAVENIECGNGVLLDNGGGLETQYCHMQMGSVAVAKGQSVKRGDVLGMVGASGLAAFPHVHLTVRQDGAPLDPSTARALDAGCATDAAAATPLWMPETARLVGEEGALLDIGFAGAPIEHETLSAAPPAPPDANSAAFVGWAWFINLREGDVITLRLTDATGAVVAENTLAPLERNKADYSAFVGKKGAPTPGEYTIAVTVVRDGTVVIEQSKALMVAD